MSLNRKPASIIDAVIAGAATGAYATGDQIGVPVELRNAVEDSGGSATVESISILDPAKQDAAVDAIFFSDQPSVGTDNAPWAPTAADLALICGVVKIAATTPYSDGSARSVGTVGGVSVKVKAKNATSGQSKTSLWVLLVSRGTPNYGAAAATLTLRVGIDKD